MSRVFAYARVSTVDQLTENQAAEIANAGYEIESRRYVEEKISGSVSAMQRPEFSKLMDRMEQGDTLIVTKLDRLGRDNIDVQQTVKLCEERGIRLVVLQLGGTDLTSSAGKMIVTVLAAMADFERELIVERTKAGLERAKAEGKRLGRKAKLTVDQRQAILKALNAGQLSISELARKYDVSRATIHSVRAGAEEAEQAP